MFETDLLKTFHEGSSFFVKSLQSRMAYPVLSSHLSNQQLRVGFDQHLAMTGIDEVGQCGDQAAIFSDVVGRDS